MGTAQRPRLAEPLLNVVAAIAEDAKVKQILRDARSRPSAPMVTETSTREAAALIAEFRSGSAAALMARIKRKDLLTREELVERLGGSRRWVTSALKGERLFAVQAPAGADYFPAFYAAPSIDRRALGNVAKVLSRLPGASKRIVSKSPRICSLTLDGTVLEIISALAGWRRTTAAGQAMPRPPACLPATPARRPTSHWPPCWR